MEVLLLGLFYQKGKGLIYDRKDGETIDQIAFDASSGFLVGQDDGEFVGQQIL